MGPGRPVCIPRGSIPPPSPPHIPLMSSGWGLHPPSERGGRSVDPPSPPPSTSDLKVNLGGWLEMRQKQRCFGVLERRIAERLQSRRDRKAWKSHGPPLLGCPKVAAAQWPVSSGELTPNGTPEPRGRPAPAPWPRPLLLAPPPTLRAVPPLTTPPPLAPPPGPAPTLRTALP